MTNELSQTVAVEFRQLLVDCRQLYLNSGRECYSDFPQLITQTRRDFLEWMDDLHRGLLIKVYCHVAMADLTWEIAEQELAAILFLHVWNRDLHGEALEQAMAGLVAKARKLKWFSLTRPFIQISPLRDHFGELETIVIRLANLIAKADGEVHPSEVDALHALQSELDKQVQQIASPDRTLGKQQDKRRGRTAVDQTVSPSKQVVTEIEADASAMRSECELVHDDNEVDSEPSAAERLAEALESLDQLIGLDEVKDEVRTLTNFLQLQQKRAEAGLPKTDIVLHMVFTGNPGTGKTTVARIVAKILGAMGVVKSGHLVETDRSGLVAEYAGQTGPKTNAIIDEALDGVLFIDEAYSLVSDSQDDAFGREALQTLLKRMEDDRDRLVVILAGYPEPMQDLLKTNPGLSSRFNRTLHFKDYQPPDLGRIFERLCKTNHYVLTPATRRRLLIGFEYLYRHRDEHFGNGRMVRNLFEDAIRRLSNRIAGIAPVTQQLLTHLDVSDIHFDLPDTALMDNEDFTVVFQCIGCKKKSPAQASILGRKVRCRNCNQVFSADWGEILNPGS